MSLVKVILRLFSTEAKQSACCDGPGYFLLVRLNSRRVSGTNALMSLLKFMPVKVRLHSHSIHSQSAWSHRTLPIHCSLVATLKSIRIFDIVRNFCSRPVLWLGQTKDLTSQFPFLTFSIEKESVKPPPCVVHRFDKIF